MLRYLNPGGYNFGPQNFDGYGISYIVVAITYSLLFYAACIFVWTSRNHPTVRKRNVPLLLLSLLTLHVYVIMVLIVYVLNGAFPCQVEFWCMSLYLPIGIGLFQAQNQQLLLVSQGQGQLLVLEEPFTRLPYKRQGIGRSRYWLYRLKSWWATISKAGQYQSYVLFGIIVQFLVSLIIYNISRKFNRYGVVSRHEGPALFRRGWEWAPSIIWQFLWNYFFGPYLLWKIRMIRDIYHWHLQTMLAVAAGLLGTPMWLASVYTDSFSTMNKYWVPAMWLVPGLMTVEIVTLGFPIYNILKHRRSVRETHRVLEEFDTKRLGNPDGLTTTSSLNTSGTTHFSRPATLASKRGALHSMYSLEQCLSSNHDDLQIYASCMELNGENIVFLTRVMKFRSSCVQALQATCRSTSEFRKARTIMFRIALSIFVSLVHARTATYPINIESIIYARLDSIFGPATTLVASAERSEIASIATRTSSNVTPWDEPKGEREEYGSGSYPMRTISGDSLPQLQPTMSQQGLDTESQEHIMTATNLVSDDGSVNPSDDGALDILEGVEVPAEFDETVFDAAFKSVKYMVWTGTWQRYMSWNNKVQGTDSRVSVREIHG